MFYQGSVDRAKALLTEATTIAPTYAAPVFNLGVIARNKGHTAEAQRYQQAYAQLVTSPRPTPPPGNQETETIAGVIPGTLSAVR